MLKGKTIILGISGSIAAYKIAGLARMLTKQHAQVHVIMTKNAVNFINPITFETLTAHRCLVDTFDRNFEFNVEHVALAKQADLVMVAPASANIIAKMAHGIADDMLSTTVLACNCKKLVSPAMNTKMYENPVTQDNLAALKRYGFLVIDPVVGMLANRDVGSGKMPEPEELYDFIIQELGHVKDLKGKRVLVTAGATKEPIDPVRYLTNHSTGKMGYAIAKAAAMRGAEVTLVSGEAKAEPYRFVNLVKVDTAGEMFDAVAEYAPGMDMIIKAAAVADYRPVHTAAEKVKKTEADLSIALTRTTDILAYLGANRREGQKLCGFAMETENLLENARAKLVRKNVDMIVANQLRTPGAGFGTDTNVVTMITKDEETALPLMTKEKVAHQVLDRLKSI